MKQNLIETLRRAGAAMKDPGAELNFSLYTPRPGHPDWKSVSDRADTLVKTALQNIDTDSLRPDNLARDAVRITDALLTNARSMRTNRDRLATGSQTLLPPYVIWTMHNTCNFRCTYCDNHREEKYFDLPNNGVLDTEQGKQLLGIIRKNVTGLYFCGGEPTLRRDLAELTEHAWNLRYFPLMINTNGSRIHRMLADPAYHHWLSRMDIVIVSLDALDTERLADVWGVKRDLCEQVIANILALRRLQSRVRFKLIVNTVITPDTIAEADSILDWTSDLDIWYSPVPMNCGPKAMKELTGRSDYRDLTQKIAARKKEGRRILGSRRLIESLLQGKPIRCLPSLKPHVDIDGALYWPCKTRSRIDTVKVNLLDFPSLDAAYNHAASILSPDNIHGNGPGQCGADCNWMQNYVSDTYARGLMNPLRSGLLAEIAEFVGMV